MNESKYKTGDESISERYPVKLDSSRDIPLTTENGHLTYPRSGRRERRIMSNKLKFSDQVRKSLRGAKKYHKKPGK